LNQIEMEMAAKSISGLDHRDEDVFIDCFDVNEDRLARELTSFLVCREVIARHKADETFPCVSAASIVAKVNRDSAISHLDELSQERWGVSIGSGYPSDPATCRFLEFIDESGEEMPFFVRRSWKTVGRFRQLKLDL
nr:ribonuclease HII [Candidatus Methanofastidiosa archaeon]